MLLLLSRGLVMIQWLQGTGLTSHSDICLNTNQTVANTYHLGFKQFNWVL